jgi:hypothetical protein
MVDVVDRRGKLALVIIDDPARHVLRRQAAIGPYRRDHRDADVGENVGGCPTQAIEPDSTIRMARTTNV